MQTIHAQRGATTVMDQEYHFDSLGNLKWRRDDVNSLTQHFCYDNMNRLVSARFNSCTSGDGDLTYDALGNIASKLYVGSYQYNQTHNAGPHAVTAANGLTYRYDLNGNLTEARDTNNQIVRSVQYSAFNKPTRIDNENAWTQITYGPDQSRIKREDSTGRTTYYMGELFEETTYGGITHRIHTIGDFAQYVEKFGIQTGSYVEYIHRDHIGSVVAKTRNTTSGIENLAYDPWGNRLLIAWDGIEAGNGYNEPNVRGFTDHEHLDPVGLIHMNGRVFDPELGRFLSPDPFVQAPYNTQSYNRYSYVFNNPLSYTDPTGYMCSGYDSNGCGASFDFDTNAQTEEVIVIGQRPGETGMGSSDYFLWGTYFAQQQQSNQFSLYDFFKGAVTKAWDDYSRNIHYSPMGQVDGMVFDATSLADLCECDYESKLGEPGSDSEALGRKAAPLVGALLLTVTKRPGSFRKKNVKDSWDNAADGSKPGTKQCPTCGNDVEGNPHLDEKRNGPNGWDNDHQPKWKDRDLTGMDRKQVLDEYNKDTRLRCPSCNRSDNQ